MPSVMSVCASHSPGMARDVAEEHGSVFRQGMVEAAEAIAEFDPTLVVLFGSDHRRAFTEVVPAAAVCLQAVGLGDHGTPTDEYRVPTSTAMELLGGLLAHGYEVARVAHVALDHGFGHGAQVLLGGLGTRPVVPVFINCATAPMVRPDRAASLGAVIGDLLADRSERVLFLGSGGLSHDPPTLALVETGLPEEERREISRLHRDAAKQRIRPDWDAAFLERLTDPDPSWAFGITQDDIDPAGVGANEIRNWLAAYCAAGLPMRTVAYERVDEWITGMGVAMSRPAERPMRTVVASA